MKKILISLATGLFIGILIGYFVSTFEIANTQKNYYYRGIFNYCAHVTIFNLETGEFVNRNGGDCMGLIRQLQEKQFYEKYNFPMQ